MSDPFVGHMWTAIALARASRENGGHPIGAVIAKGETVIAQAVTTLRWENDPTCHAEINAIRAACKLLASRRLDGYTLYSTFEPCPMCASAAVWARMSRIVFGALLSDQTGNAKQRISIPAQYVVERGEPRPELVSGFLREECVQLIC